MEENEKNKNINLSEIEREINNKPNVSNMQNSRGNINANQFIIRWKDYALFQSYNSPIALIDYKNNTTYIFKDWDYSTTTGRYRNLFLRETKKETLAKLKSGEYIAVGFEVVQ